MPNPVLKPQRKNANKHTEHGLRLLEKSVQKDGWIDSQTAAADGEMISGTARLELSAEKFADVEPIIVESDGTRPVVVVRTDIPNLDDPRARRLSVAANQIQHVDYSPDGEILREWGGEDEDIRKMFADSEWREVTGEEKPSADAEPQVDRAAELLEKWQVKMGDLWQIGNHRLLCGDSTKAEDVERVMGGERWDIGFTSPPYNSGNADFTYDYKAEKEGGFYKDDTDDLSTDDYMNLLFGVLENYKEFANDAHALFWNVMYNANSRDTYGKIVFSDRNPFMVRETIVWNKIGGFPVAGTNILSRNSELIFLFSLNERYLSNQTLRDCIYWNRWDISNSNSQQREGKHKACFPIELPSKAVEDFSKEGMTCLDLFGGTGTTLVACEKLGRRGRAIEISPAYIAVTLERLATAFPSLEIKRLE